MSAVTMGNDITHDGGPSALDYPLHVTFFKDAGAHSKQDAEVSLRALIPRFQSTSAPSKALLPWIKLATFGNQRTDRGSLRHDRNILSVHGIEADYDGETITVERARQIIASAGLAAVIYTSPSHTDAAPRWRILCPLAIPIGPEQRARMVARLNGLFVGALARESFTASQAYYYGFIQGATDHCVVAIDGRALDLADELDAQAVGRPERHTAPQAQPIAPRPVSPSNHYGDSKRNSNDGTPYGLAALEDATTLILSAPDGAKFDTLNRQAFGIGQLVGAGELAQSPAITALRSALEGIRHRCEDFAHAEKGLRVAFEQGMAQPRQAPAPRLVRRIVEEYRDDRPEPPPRDEAPPHWSMEPDPEPPQIEVERIAPSAGKSPLWVDRAAFNAAAIPRRPWAVPGYLMRGSVTVLSGQGAGGKSSLVVRWTIAAATGQAIGQFAPSAPLKVVNYNTEDDIDEQQRRYSAALKASGHDPDVMQDIIRCGPEDVGTLFERDQATGRITPTAAMAQLEELCVSTDADVLFCDPLAELHNAEENDNTAMRAVVAAFRSLAKRLKIAVVILHHDRKGNSSPGDMDRVRGASAISGAVRVMLTLTTMTEEEAEKLGIRPEERRRHFRIDGAKSNYAPTQEAEWWRLAAYEIENGEQIAACMPWQAPSPWAGLQWDQITKIIAEIEAGPGRAGALWMVDKKGAFWAGHVLMKHSSLNEKQAGVLLKAWEANGVLQHEPFTNEKGNERNGYTVNRTKFSEMRQQKEAA
jgi:hypothetical protein